MAHDLMVRLPISNACEHPVILGHTGHRNDVTDPHAAAIQIRGAGRRCNRWAPLRNARFTRLEEGRFKGLNLLFQLALILRIDPRGEEVESLRRSCDGAIGFLGSFAIHIHLVSA